MKNLVLLSLLLASCTTSDYRQKKDDLKNVYRTQKNRAVSGVSGFLKETIDAGAQVFQDASSDSL